MTSLLGIKTVSCSKIASDFRTLFRDYIIEKSPQSELTMEGKKAEGTQILPVCKLNHYYLTLNKLIVDWLSEECSEI